MSKAPALRVCLKSDGLWVSRWTARLYRSWGPGIRGDAELTATWRDTADEIKADILAHGVWDDRGVLRQHYETDAARDASTLLAAIFGFLPADRRAAARQRAGDRRRADRERLRAALPHQGDRRRVVGQGGDLPDLFVLAGVRVVDHRGGAARPGPDGSACSGSPHLSGCSPRSSTSTRVDTSATSRRCSRTSPSSRRRRG